MCKSYPLKKLSEKKKVGCREIANKENKSEENEERKSSLKQVKAIKRKLKNEIESIKKTLCRKDLW